VETVITAFKNGIFQVQATNFTFSSPTIKTKILQQTSSIETTSATPIVKPMPKASPVEKTTVISKKLTITCIKGKMTKKVTAVKPKCPSGYKKK
jgi:hypothetical protein